MSTINLTVLENAAQTLQKAYGRYDETKHPRKGKGQQGGGQFAPKGGVAAQPGSVPQRKGEPKGKLTDEEYTRLLEIYDTYFYPNSARQKRYIPSRVGHEMRALHDKRYGIAKPKTE